MIAANVSNFLVNGMNSTNCQKFHDTTSLIDSAINFHGNKHHLHMFYVLGCHTRNRKYEE